MSKQLYWPDTNVLITRFFSADGVGKIVVCMPVGTTQDGHGHYQLIRRVEAVRGTGSFRLNCSPAFDYAREEPETEVSDRGACFYSSKYGLGLATRVSLKQ